MTSHQYVRGRCANFLGRRIRQGVLMACLGIPLSAGALAEPVAAGSAPCGPLSFTDFPAHDTPVVTTKAPLMLEDGTPEWRYRNAIQAAYERVPVNFNGRYVAFDVDCGADCRLWVFVDATNGQIYRSGTQSSASADFRLNSRLFVINPPPKDARAVDAASAVSAVSDKPVRYRVWKDEGLEPACKLGAAAYNWGCSNEDLQVSCDGKGCQVDEHFTPLSVGGTIDGEVSLCAYTGCWVGQAKYWQAHAHHVWSAKDVPWSWESGQDGNFLLAINAATGVGMLVGEGFATPMLCEASAEGDE